MKQIISDVAIIGAGCGGVMAAAKIAEAGYTVALFEKSKGIGPGLGGVNGIFAVETDLQKEQGYTTTRKQIYDFLMMHNHHGVDANVVSLFVNRSKEVYEWVYERGTRVSKCVITPLGEHTWLYFDNNTPRLDTSVGDYYREQRGSTLYDCSTVKQVEKDGDGWILTGEDSSGEFTAKCTALIIATGEDQVVMGGTVLSEYKGLDMALSLGAEKTMAYANPVASLGFAPHHVGQPGVLVVNLLGERLMNEDNLFNTEDYQLNISLQPEQKAIYIINEDVNQYYVKNGYFREGPFGKEKAHDVNDTISGKVSGGMPGPPPKKGDDGEDTPPPMPERDEPKIKRFETLEELAADYGIDISRLKATVAEYTDMAEKGSDERFFKDSRYMIPMKNGPWYGYEVSFTMQDYEGLIRINDRMQVIAKENRRPIPGLYAIGGVANPINGPMYTHCTSGSRSTFGLLSGMVAGETVPEYLKSLK